VLPRFPVSRALGENRAPEVGCLDVVASLFGQRGQVAPGELAVDALIDTGRRNGSSGRSASSSRRIMASRSTFLNLSARSV